MPKEITHWVAAEQVLKSGRLTPEITNLDEHRDVLLIGAVIHDALYYFTGDSKEASALPDKLHGSNQEDTHSLVKAILQKSEKSRQKDILLAFATGVASHIYADINFHPYIYYHTGNYYDQNPDRRAVAQLRHRQLESALDNYLNKKFSPELNFSKMVNSGLAKLRNVLADGLDAPEIDTRIEWAWIESAFKNYVLARRIYGNRAMVSALSLFGGFLPQTLQTVLSLSYFKCGAFTHYDFGQEIRYKNPESGEWLETTIDGLLNKSISDSIEFLNAALDEERISTGRSLETGLERSRAIDMRHFDTTVHNEV
ncbi:zinc dependent phospholipase C family protein [Motiliproteus sp. SC1-56]|uniref:zinc dependent phospholipase C family protein n=1 Tax=Motiliproteus sp. SC1-56 TaxID=2799565 RepID=UPI001A8D225B|nr:zinc dependent phospholipase C family protein [Motiliproteus sp. SC1-56]